MKKIIAICLLVAAVFMGGISIEAKTNKKKTIKTTKTTKKKSTSTSSVFSVEGKSYERSWSGTTLNLTFKKNGNGVKSFRKDWCDPDLTSFTWRQSGDEVTIYSPNESPTVLKLGSGGSTLSSGGDGWSVFYLVR